MSDLKYGSGFYLIEVATEEYDLFNSATDNKILNAQPKEKIISFLETNLPSHPFLSKISLEVNADYFRDYFRYLPQEEIDKYPFSKKDISELMAELDPSKENDDTCYYIDSKYEFDYDNYKDTTDFSNLFNYDNEEDYVVGDEEGTKTEYPYNPQLEFNFTYKDNKNKKTISSNDSTDNKEDKIPYLPDGTEGDTE
jgi:hypothetical protein